MIVERALKNLESNILNLSPHIRYVEMSRNIIPRVELITRLDVIRRTLRDTKLLRLIADKKHTYFLSNKGVVLDGRLAKLLETKERTVSIEQFVERIDDAVVEELLYVIVQR